MQQTKKLYLPGKLYKKVIASLPIECVDVVIKTPNGILLGKRTNQPAKGKVWLMGGRVMFGETPEQSVIRKVKEETGLKVKIEKFVGVYTVVFTKGEVRHNIALLFVAKQIGGKLKPDKQHSKFVFLKKLDKSLHPYVRQTLTDSGVFGVKKARKNTAKLPFYLN